MMTQFTSGHRTTIALWGTLMLGFAVCGQPLPDPQLAERAASRPRIQAMAGCWGFSAMDFLPDPDRYLPSGVVVRFDTAAYEPNDAYRLALRVDRGYVRNVRIGYWALAERPYQVIAFWGNGQTGVELRVTIRSSKSAYKSGGRAYLTRDGRFSGYSTTVIANRAPCPPRL